MSLTTMAFVAYSSSHTKPIPSPHVYLSQESSRSLSKLVDELLTHRVLWTTPENKKIEKTTMRTTFDSLLRRATSVWMQELHAKQRRDRASLHDSDSYRPVVRLPKVTVGVLEFDPCTGGTAKTGTGIVLGRSGIAPSKVKAWITSLMDGLCV